MSEMRNLVIGCDGTWNETQMPPDTNVAKLLRALSASGQVQHYEEGVGTAHMEALPGGIYGQGLDRQILGAYRFLSNRFSDSEWPAERNRIFIFGFSRGAYAARRLAGLVSRCGVPTEADDVELAWRLYLNRDNDSMGDLKERGFLVDVPVAVLGVWDTVKTTTDEDFDDHKLPDCVEHGYHAMAIDERRRFFRVLRWNKDDRVRQVWFAGVHSDIGGGYEETGLSDIALKWMIDCAYGHGLKFKASAVERFDPDPCGPLHDSYTGIWKPFGARRRSIAKSALVHSSVRERCEQAPDYRPANLPAEANYVDE
ncbi:hypothetical protein PC39_08339 [Salinisphaera sp. PC39]|uniref:DUF2235 domain-containing protein n=1 Tax=Salinisphaera sp. PC39 TaxID=1304156 RepID=UPI00333F0939